MQDWDVVCVLLALRCLPSSRSCAPACPIWYAQLCCKLSQPKCRPR